MDDIDFNQSKDLNIESTLDKSQEQLPALDEQHYLELKLVQDIMIKIKQDVQLIKDTHENQ